MSRQFDVYDFDGTVYDGDASLDFYFFCLRHQPSLIIYLPYQFLFGLLFILRLQTRTQFKSRFFIFLKSLKNTAKNVDAFWEGHFSKIKSWYAQLDHANDIIISASPEFLISPAAEKLGIYKLVATKMDEHSGEIEGQNNRGAEKVQRLKAIIGDGSVRRAYGNSRADRPILELAKEAFVVKGDKLTPYKN